MDKIGRSTYKRIRSARLSLENAEQSFLDNKDMRGELDLMLAEAELKNLRRKQSFPWSWNRQLLALGIAGLLVLAGAGGWYYAHMNNAQSPVVKEGISYPLAIPVDNSLAASPNSIVVLPQNGEININNLPMEGVQETRSRVQPANVNIKQLVHSARVELSSSN